jgi:hypothetical protein
MQSTGQTSTHPVSQTPTQAWVMTNGMRAWKSTTQAIGYPPDFAVLGDVHLYLSVLVGDISVVQ